VALELTGRSRIRVALLATGCALAGGAGATAHASTSVTARPGARVALRGTAVPAARSALDLRAVPAARPVQAVVILKPRNPALLQRLALHSSGRPGLSEARIRSLFAPAPADARAVRAYLAEQGLRVVARTDMTMTVSGTATAAERAFGVGLRVFRTARGTTFSAPDGAVRLPAAIAPAVQTVTGLDTSVRLRAADTVPVAAAAAAGVTPNCSGATASQRRFGGYLPGDLGQTSAYGQSDLIGSGANGTGERIGLVEFSGYARSDVNRFRACFPAVTGAYASDATVGQTNFDTSGKVEVALDLEVAMAAAPDARVQAYIAPNNPSYLPVILDRMRRNGIDIISDSWGACEPLLSPNLLQAENTALQLVAVAGISTYVATGDFGSADCYPFVGSTNLFTDDPSSQPFATAVGGTALEVPPVYGTHRETAWRGSGGGISMWWTKPSYQLGRTISVRGRKCRGGRAQCRETPDISLDARPKRSGYIVYCDRCGFGAGVAWAPVGGTSAAAPLMAGLTADADEDAGKQLGFANPFLYAQAGTSVFHDIVSGTNNLLGGTHFRARPGYDLATGLGSIRAGAFATALAAYAPGAVTPDTSRLTVAGPVDGKRIRYGQKVTFSGTLTDTTTGQPIANGPVMVVTNLGVFRDRTDPAGRWSVSRSKAILRNLTWHVAYLGSGATAPASTANRTVYVTPHLGIRIGLPFGRGRYLTRPGRRFTVHGGSKPVMAGAEVELQERSGGSWTSLGVTRVSGGGSYERTVTIRSRRTVALRWAFLGGALRKWLPSHSRTRTVVSR
jgi:Pro-kumamolisin, activation domain